VLDFGLDEFAADYFALVVFLSDGLLQLKDLPDSPAMRFFRIATRLHMDLQMTLCNRAFRSPAEVIATSKVEFALRCLSRPFVWRRRR